MTPMVMKIRLTSVNGTNLSLYNLILDPRETVMDIGDAVEDNIDEGSSAIASALNSLGLDTTFYPDRETDKYIRLKGTDLFGNRRYLTIPKGE